MENQYIFADTNQLKEFQCPVCFKYFSRKFTLDMHLLIHKGVKPHPCPFCNKSFRQKGTLMRHKALHSANNLFYCKLCNRGFRQKNVFLHHLKHQHNVSTECLDRRKYRTELKDYQSIMDTLPAFVHADSTAIASSEKHLDAMLLESLNNSVCDSSASENLTGYQKRQFSCRKDIFGTVKASYNNTVNRNHQRIQYQCSVCLSYYNEYAEYKKHVENNHDNVGMLLDCKPVICDIPSQSEERFSTELITAYKEKSKINSKKGLSSCENTNVCVPCQDSFNSVEEYESHVKSHVVTDSELGALNKSFSLSTNSKYHEICDYSSESETNVSNFQSQSFKLENPCSPSEPDDKNSLNKKSNVKNVSSSNIFKPKTYPVNCDGSKKQLSANCIYSSVNGYRSNSPKLNCDKQSVPSQKLNMRHGHQSKPFELAIDPLAPFCKKVFKCQICNKICHSKLIYEYHRQLHLDTRGFRCGYCKRNFSNKKLLLSHTRSAHMKTFHCNSCSRSFNYRSLYNFHQMKCSTGIHQIGDMERFIGLPLVDIRKIIDSDTKDIVGVIPICDEHFSKISKIKIGIPIVSLEALKNLSEIPLINSIQIKGSMREKVNSS